MPWNGSGAATSGLAEWMSISLLKPSPTSSKVRVQPAGASGSRRASNESESASPGRATTNRSSVFATSSEISPGRV